MSTIKEYGGKASNVESQFLRMNELGTAAEPFFFLIDYAISEIYVWRLSDLPPFVKFTFPKSPTSKTNTARGRKNQIKIVQPPTFEQYRKQFALVRDEIRLGNSYLLNLCMETQIETALKLSEMYAIANAKYKVLWEERFVFFSPEPFVQLQGNTIKTFPMKGTSEDLSAESKKALLEDEKEIAEHNTVVDLLRNDLSMISKSVRLDKFRFLEAVETSNKGFWQASSEISGKLENNWQRRLGDLVRSLLPAGSVTGAPKKETVEIINRTEHAERGFYTGISGFFDGSALDTSVNIRFIQKRDGKLYFKSGGGITFLSEAKNEYDECVRKVQLPLL